MTPGAAFVAAIVLVAACACTLRAAALALRATVTPLTPRGADELLGATLAAIASALALAVVLGG